MREKRHILEVLEKAKEAIRKEDAIKLKELSNQTIHSASIEQDSESIFIAVIVYSLSKIIERTNYKEYPGWKKFFMHTSIHLGKACEALEQDKEEKFGKELRKLRKEISRLTGDFQKHAKAVFEKARINKASRIYEHGISMEKTAKLLGISIWELAEYAGKTGISDVNLNITLPIKQRFKLAEEFFR